MDKKPLWQLDEELVTDQALKNSEKNMRYLDCENQFNIAFDDLVSKLKSLVDEANHKSKLFEITAYKISSFDNRHRWHGALTVSSEHYDLHLKNAFIFDEYRPLDADSNWMEKAFISLWVEIRDKSTIFVKINLDRHEIPLSHHKQSELEWYTIIFKNIEGTFQFFNEKNKTIVSPDNFLRSLLSYLILLEAPFRATNRRTEESKITIEPVKLQSR